MTSRRKISLPVPYIFTGAALMTLAAATEKLMGRKLWGVGGQPGFWSGDIDGPHNSQYMLDPYSFSHINHGLLFYGLLHVIGRKLPLRVRALLALVIEAAWEMAENSDAIIDRYRAQTVSQHYYGDSIVNSMCDILCMLIGFLLASRLPVWASIALFIVIEAAMAATLRDSLLLNILMLTYPLESVRQWQMHKG